LGGGGQANGADVDQAILYNVTTAINQVAPVLARVIIPHLPQQPGPANAIYGLESQRFIHTYQ